MELKELERIIKLCRKTGVSTITIEGVTLTLTAEAPSSPYKRRTGSSKAPVDPFELAMSQAKDAASKAKVKYMSEQEKAKEASQATGGAPTELEMLYWSAGGSEGASQQ